MERGASLGELASAYAVALRLRDAGHTQEIIAEGLDIDVRSVEPLLTVAEAQLSRILARHQPTLEAD